MARTSFTWERVGPREEERLLAGRVAAVLWLTVLPMIAVGFFLPGEIGDHPGVLALLSIPAAVWGVTCLFLPWERVPTPLFFHVPAALALPYIALLVAITGAEHSPFGLTLLMLIGFCAYFFTPRAAIPYVVCSLIVLAFPLLYAPDALDSELLSTVWVATFVYAAVGGVIMVGKQQLLSLRDEARALSMRDSLTGLANRRALAELLRERLGGTRRDDSIGLLLLDLDNFKDANTLHGFPIGDSVLVAVGQALASISRQGDTVARLGGDEFAIVGHGLTRESTEWLAERAVEHVREACRDMELPGVEITASVGWAVYPDDVSSVEELLTMADLSLRAAKVAGKNRSHAPSPDLAQLA